MSHQFHSANEQQQQQHSHYHHQRQQSLLSSISAYDLSSNTLSNLSTSNINSEWVLFDPSSDEENDILSSSYSRGLSSNNGDNDAVVQQTAATAEDDEEKSNNDYDNDYEAKLSKLNGSGGDQQNNTDNYYQRILNNERNGQYNSRKFSISRHNQIKNNIDDDDDDEEDDQSLVNILLTSKHRQRSAPDLTTTSRKSPKLKLQVPHHDGSGLFQDALLVRNRNSFASLKDRINDWQQDQAASLLKERQKHSLVRRLSESSSNTNELAESWGIDNHAHFYSSTNMNELHESSKKQKRTSFKRNAISNGKDFKNLLNNNNNTRKTARFYGDYLFKGLNEHDLNKVKTKAKEFSTSLTTDAKDKDLADTTNGTAENTFRNTLSNKSSLFSNPLLKPLLLSTFLINRQLYSDHGSGSGSGGVMGVSSNANSGSGTGLSSNAIANIIRNSNNNGNINDINGGFNRHQSNPDLNDLNGLNDMARTVSAENNENEFFWENDAQSLYSSRLSVASSSISSSSQFWHNGESWGEVI